MEYWEAVAEKPIKKAGDEDLLGEAEEMELCASANMNLGTYPLRTIAPNFIDTYSRYVKVVSMMALVIGLPIPYYPMFKIFFVNLRY